MICGESKITTWGMYLCYNLRHVSDPPMGQIIEMPTCTSTSIASVSDTGQQYIGHLQLTHCTLLPQTALDN